MKKKGIIKSRDYLEKIFQKNYYINTQYQIRTLTDFFIVDYLGEKDSDVRLLECINAYLYLKHEEFTSEHPTQVAVQQKDVVEIFTLKNVDYAKLSESYNKIYWSLIDDCNLSNPRTFLKFSHNLLDIWPEYYSNFIIKREIQKYELHAAFIALITFIINPQEFTYDILSYSSEKNIKDSFLKKVKNHLSLLLPELTNQIDDKRTSYRINDGIIREALSYFNKYPDLSRRKSSD